MSKIVSDSTQFSTHEVKPEKSPHTKYQLYEAQNRRESTKKVAKQAVDEYLEFANENYLEYKENETIVKYKDWLENPDERGQAINTIRRKLEHVKTYLREAFGIKVFTNFYKGREKLVNPHEAYDKQDLVLLIEEMKKKANSFISNKNS